MIKKLIIIEYREVRAVIMVRKMSVKAVSIKYFEFGEPRDVLRVCIDDVSDPKENEVLLRILAAPVNPVDINTIQGKYPVKPKLPAIGGKEFVGEVLAMGKKVKKFNIGEHVIPAATELPAWTSITKCNEKDLMPISNKIGIVEAATLTINSCTAYRMLKDFVSLQPNDTVILNGANSAVGQAILQISAAWSLNTVGLVRDRPGIREMKSYLKCLGASEILTQNEFEKTDIFKGSSFKRPKLALDCIGGDAATEISKHLDNRGVMVTYGGMSRNPLKLQTGPLIFKDITFKGFLITRWTNENFDSEERTRMFIQLCRLIETGQLKPPKHEIISYKNYMGAIAATLGRCTGFNNTKYILDFQECTCT